MGACTVVHLHIWTTIVAPISVAVRRVHGLNTTAARATHTDTHTQIVCVVLLLSVQLHIRTCTPRGGQDRWITDDVWTHTICLVLFAGVESRFCTISVLSFVLFVLVFVFVCVCVCMYVCMYVCRYVCVCVCLTRHFRRHQMVRHFAV